MKIQKFGRDLPSIFKEVTQVEQSHSSQYATGIGDATITIYDVYIDEVIGMPYLATSEGPSQKDFTEVWRIEERFFFLTGQEIAREDLQKVLSGGAHFTCHVVSYHRNPLMLVNEPPPWMD
jgi:hypothetical protein